MNRRKVDGSRKVASVGYDAHAQCLEIEYVWGHIVRYFRVPPELAAALDAAPSKGSFLHQHIEHHLPFARLRPGEDEIAPVAPEFTEPEADSLKEQKMFDRGRDQDRAGEDIVPSRRRRMRLL